MILKHSHMLLSLFVTIAVARTARAQDDSPETHRGALTVKSDANVGTSVTQRTPGIAGAERVLAVLRRDDAISRPVGYTVSVRRFTAAHHDGDLPNMQYRYGVRGDAVYFGIADDGKGQTTIAANGGSYNFQLTVNAVGYPAEMDNSDRELDGGPRVLGADEGGVETYRVTGQLHGRPIYGGNCTYVSRKPVPPIIPVTKQRYIELELLRARGDSSRHATRQVEVGSAPISDQLERFLRDRPKRDADNQKTIAELKKAGIDDASLTQMREAFKKAEADQESALRSSVAGGGDRQLNDIVKQGRAGEAEKIRQLHDQLDAMSPTERRSPAILSPLGRGMFRLARAEDEDSLPLMQPNPAFFDRSLAPEVPQVIWVCIDGLQGFPDKRTYEHHAEGSEEYDRDKKHAERVARDVSKIRDGLDWSALEALIKP